MVVIDVLMHVLIPGRAKSFLLFLDFIGVLISPV